MQLSVMWEVNRLRKSDQHSALVTLTSYSNLLLPRDFGASKFKIERETIRHASMADYVPGYISATPVAAAVAGLDKEAQAKFTTDVRDALAAYRVGDGLAAPIETHLAIGYR